MPVRASRRCATARAPPGRGGWAGHAAARRPRAEDRVRVHDTRRPARPAHRLGPRGCGPGELRRLHLPLSVRARGAVGYSATLPRGRRAEGLAASRPRRTEPPVSHGGVCALRPLRRLGGDGPAARRRRVGHRRAHGFRALVPGAPAAPRRMTAPAKLLIVTADDFGISRGVNRGIAQAHREGILTSTSLMVNRPASVQAADVGRACPALNIGLHLELDAGVTALTCHAGYVDEGLTSSYTVEREAELRTLCDQRVRQALAERGIRLVGFRDLPALLAASPVSEGAA